jgi:murein L,D-transpeptidase YcbB/YkuD
VLNKKHKDDKYFEDVNPAYSTLKDQLNKYVDIAKKGGWPQISVTKKRLKKGMMAPEIAVIKKRLEVTGDLQGDDSSSAFNDTLVAAIKNFQERHGYSPTGNITDSLIKEMNVPVVKRIQQIIMNMERMRWMATRQNGNLIVVNIRSFVLHVYEGSKKAFDMDVVVGKEGHNTTMFNGDLNQVVFCPNWNVPQSIVQKGNHSGPWKKIKITLKKKTWK